MAAGLAAAFAGGFVATRLRLSPTVGYLLSGVLIGPFTPGFVANKEIAHELAEMGVILLMFGVGIHFSLRDLLTVRSIAVPGALVQVTVSVLLGIGVALSWQWSLGAGLVLGVCLSIASTVVMLRALGDRQLLASASGRVAIGWLIVQDLITVLVLVLLPGLAPALGGAGANAQELLLALGIALVKVVILAALVLVVGSRVIPPLLVQVIKSGSRELFTLAVLTIALGIAVLSAVAFGVSLALGAFLAGVVVAESELSHQAAADALPLRDAFAVLFFVSVGMLFDPLFLLTEPLKILTALGLVLVGNGLTAFLLVLVLGYPLRTALLVCMGLVQIGEFSFILAEVGRNLGLLPDTGYNLVLTTAIIWITLNPWLFRLIEPIERLVQRQPGLAMILKRQTDGPSNLGAAEQAGLRGHAVLCGHGRVGRLLADALDRRGFRYVVIEQEYRRVEELHERGIVALCGDSANAALLKLAQIEHARVLVVAFDDPPSTRMVVDEARRLNPNIAIVARAHGKDEWRHLREHGVDDVVLGELELATEMVRFTLHRFGVGGPELQAVIQGLRRRGVELE
ncbi:MAG TPA: cation:proton antiporter [Chloroflexota bacterium]|nr:cation:proton antiporter [Chloroflexota bacterium]